MDEPMWTELTFEGDVAVRPEVHVARGEGWVEVASLFGERRLDGPDLFGTGRWGSTWLGPGGDVLLAFGRRADRRLVVDLRTGSARDEAMWRDDTLQERMLVDAAGRPGGRLAIVTERCVECVAPDGTRLWVREHGHWPIEPLRGPATAIGIRDTATEGSPSYWFSLDDGSPVPPP